MEEDAKKQFYNMNKIVIRIGLRIAYNKRKTLKSTKDCATSESTVQKVETFRYFG